MKILILLLSYLFGSVPWALIVGESFYHRDIRKEGSGNLGATNAGRVLGKPAGIAVTILDALKSFISMYIASRIAPGMELWAGLACCIGHCFPVFAGFRGGKAVATSYGFFLGISLLITGHFFWQFLFEVICFFAVLYACRMVSAASIISVGVAVPVSLFLKNDPEITVSLFVLWLFVTYRHRANIGRIMNGTESKIKWMG